MQSLYEHTQQRVCAGFTPASLVQPTAKWATKPYSTDRQKKKPHRQTSANVTDCSHILPSFHPFQGALRRTRMVGILTRTSQRTTPPALAPSLLRFYPNDQITPLRMRTFCAYSYGYSTGISPDSLISTSVNHRRVTPCSI